MPYKDPAKRIEQGKRYYRENRDGIRTKQTRYRLKTLEEERARHRKNNIKRYGITEADYLRMFEAQKGVCFICAQPQLTKRLHIDHDHTTNKVRKLLCENCNRGLGMFKDNAGLLQHASKYIQEYGA